MTPKTYYVIDEHGVKYNATLVDLWKTRVQLRWVTETRQYCRWFHATGREMRQRGDSGNYYTPSHRYEVTP